MIREEDFVLSHRQYAVDPGSLKVREHTDDKGGKYCTVSLEAVWLRRDRGLLKACAGYLGGTLPVAAPRDARDALERLRNTGWGGSCEARWDGGEYWGLGPQKPETAARYAALLKPLLASCPASLSSPGRQARKGLRYNPTPPDGYQGWWRHAPRPGSAS